MCFGRRGEGGAECRGDCAAWSAVMVRAWRKEMARISSVCWSIVAA
jgi:hypothetical protein